MATRRTQKYKHINAMMALYKYPSLSEGYTGRYRGRYVLRYWHVDPFGDCSEYEVDAREEDEKYHGTPAYPVVSKCLLTCLREVADRIDYLVKVGKVDENDPHMLCVWLQVRYRYRDSDKIEIRNIRRMIKEGI